MLKTYLLVLAALVMAVFGMRAQCTSEPSPLQEDSENVVIFFHADQGNKGLMNQPASAQIYAHTGVITSKSKNDGDWKSAPTWGDNSPKYKLEYVSANLWKLVIGDIRTYYGITDPAETIKKLAFVFRTADKSKEGKGEGNSDIFVNVVDAGLQLAIESNLTGNIVSITTVDAHFKVGTTINADIELSINGQKLAEAKSTRLLEADYHFPGAGDYKVTAKATANGQTVEKSETYCFVRDSKPSTLATLPEMGATRNADGTVTFCLAAPRKNSVILVGSWNDYAVTNEHVMDYIDKDGFRYFVVTLPGLEKNKNYMYYYYVDGEYRVSDPYARLILDPSYDKYISDTVYPNLPQYPYGQLSSVPLAVFNDSLLNYKWTAANFKPVAKENLVIYELLLRDFTGTEGKADGNGTVRQAIEKIPYLKSLGVNAIELLPINEFNGNLSWGYNPNFYFAPDKAYGTPQDYKEFIDLCHANGMAVILDMVFNQTDWLHPWYQMYQVGQNPFYNASAPHAYSVLNDWNQGYGLVEKQFEDVVKFWIEEYHVDGYRFDLVKGLGDNNSYSNSGDGATNAFNQSRINRMKRLHDAMRTVNPEAYFINENLAGAQEENKMAEDGELNWANINNAGGQFAMGYSSDSNLNRMYAPLDSRTWGSTVAYLESHDEQRMAYKQEKYGVSAVKGNVKVSMQRLGSAAAQMILVPGAHMLWQFQEMGNAENTKDDNNGNNTSNKKVNWNLLNEPNHKGLKDCYAELIGLRTANPELYTQDATFMMACNTSNWGNGRTIKSAKDGKEIITAINPLTTAALTVNVTFLNSDSSKYEIVSQSYDCAGSFDASKGTITVPANCYVTVATKGISAVEELGAEARAMSVFVQDGKLYVAGAVAPVQVYNLSGVKVAAGNGMFDLEEGVYIVKSGSDVRKVLVK